MMTHALTVWQPWATLLIEEIKPWEFRGWPIPPRLVGKRIVIHAAARPMRPAEIRDAIRRLELGHHDGMKVGPALDLLDAVWRRQRALPLRAALGSAVLGEPVRAVELFPAADPRKWAWSLGDVRRWAEPQTINGGQGFWRYPISMPEESDVWN